MIRTLIALAVAATLTGCLLGTMLYVPHGQNASLTVGSPLAVRSTAAVASAPPTAMAASAPK